VNVLYDLLKNTLAWKYIFMFIHMNEKFQILLRFRALENMYCKPKPRMCGVGRFLFHKGIKFLGRVSSFFITLPVQHPGGVGTLSSQRDFRGHIPALAASAEDWTWGGGGVGECGLGCSPGRAAATRTVGTSLSSNVAISTVRAATTRTDALVLVDSGITIFTSMVMGALNTI
jgi:hypothetical protein